MKGTDQKRTAEVAVSQTKPPGKAPHFNMVWIPGGTFRMGSEKHYPEEKPVHQVSVDGFWMDKYQVTNGEFRKFIQATGYSTVAERAPNPEDYPGAPPENLVPGSLVFHKTKGPVNLDYINLWWDWTPGAYWRQPEGPGSHTRKRKRHPVSFTSPMRMPRSMPPGQANRCPRKLSGSLPRELSGTSEKTAIRINLQPLVFH